MLTVIDTDQDNIHTTREYPFAKENAMNAYTHGGNTNHRKSTKAERKAIGEANAPAVVDTKKALLHPAIAGGIIDPWCFIADSYDDDCGMKPTAEWIDDFMVLMREDARRYTVKDWGKLGENHQRWLANAERTIKPVRVCHKCRKEISEGKPAFNWSVDRNLYCGSCYGTLEPPRREPAKVDPLVKELRDTQLVMAQALQDKNEVKPVVTSYKPRPGGLEEALIRLEHSKATCRPGYSQTIMGGMTYHWPGGWGYKVEVCEAKAEPSAPALMPATKAA